MSIPSLEQQVGGFMRILWSSNSPFVATGYGMQTAIACRHLKDMGHDVAVLAFFGLQGSKVDWGDIPIYPNNPQDWGTKHSPMFYQDFKANILITLVDAWVLSTLNPELKWVPWMPVDHNPIPHMVTIVLKKNPGLVKPIAMSKYGQKQLADNDIEAYYIPHTVNTREFYPNEEWRIQGRERYGWTGKFIIGMVGTNHSERKNWVVALKAIKMLDKMHPGEVIFYMHTNPLDDRGINLLDLRHDLEIEDITKFPSQADMVVGIPTDTMARMYNALDVFLLPTKGEGFGIPLVEAMACGIPCITTNCTAQTEIMNNAGGWLINDLKPVWTTQSSWQFDCNVEEVLGLLEQAYQAKKNGDMVDRKILAQKKALEYDENKIFKEYWPPVLEDIEKRIHAPKNLEGLQEWRLAFVPRTCLPRRVLDIGCGVKQSFKKPLEHLGEYTGIDIRDGHGVLQMDAHHLDFSDNYFGFVWLNEMLEHVDHPELVISEAKRVGKHGVCLFSTPLAQGFKLDPEHVKFQNIIKAKIPYSTLSNGIGLISW